jgi:hypothetical protein
VHKKSLFQKSSNFVNFGSTILSTKQQLLLLAGTAPAQLATSFELLPKPIRKAYCTNFASETKFRQYQTQQATDCTCTPKGLKLGLTCCPIPLRRRHLSLQCIVIPLCEHELLCGNLRLHFCKKGLANDRCEDQLCTVDEDIGFGQDTCRAASRPLLLPNSGVSAGFGVTFHLLNRENAFYRSLPVKKLGRFRNDVSITASGNRIFSNRMTRIRDMEQQQSKGHPPLLSNYFYSCRLL